MMKNQILLVFLISCLHHVLGTSSGSLSVPGSADTESIGIPRSSQTTIDDFSDASTFLPWNPSHRICNQGFLKSSYTRVPGFWEQDINFRTSISLKAPCVIRQVPGDGNCLFHSISVGLCHALMQEHWDMNSADSLKELYQHSDSLRQKAVDFLRDPNRRLFLQGNDFVKSRELVEVAAQQYGLTADEYCRDMQQQSVWGGGPEIVALSNVLKRPIHVYELTNTTKPGVISSSSDENHEEGQIFVLRRMACFGSPRFDRCRPALHILSADSRFPDIRPGQQLIEGNHFLAVFPIEKPEDDDDGGDQRKRRKKRRLRGGSRLSLPEDKKRDESVMHDYKARHFFRRLTGWWEGDEDLDIQGF